MIVKIQVALLILKGTETVFLMIIRTLANLGSKDSYIVAKMSTILLKSLFIALEKHLDTSLDALNLISIVQIIGLQNKGAIYILVKLMEALR